MLFRSRAPFAPRGHQLPGGGGARDRSRPASWHQRGRRHSLALLASRRPHGVGLPAAQEPRPLVRCSLPASRCPMGTVGMGTVPMGTVPMGTVLMGTVLMDTVPMGTAAGITRHASHTGTEISLGRLEPVCKWGTTPDLTAVRATRRVHLAPRGTERRKAGRDPGSRRGIYFRRSRVPARPPG